MPENKHVQQQQQQQQQQAQELQQQQAINANAESSRQPNREGGRPGTSRSRRQNVGSPAAATSIAAATAAAATLSAPKQADNTWRGAN